MDASGIRAGRAFVEIGASIAPLQRALDQAMARMELWEAKLQAINQATAAVPRITGFKKFTRALKESITQATAKLRELGSNMQALGQRALVSAGVMAAPLAFATRTYMGFSDQMKAVQAVTGATEAQFNMLNETAKELGRTTSYSAAEVAAGMLNLARAGFSVDEINASIAGMLNLARATGTDLAMASEIAAGTLRAFNLEASQSQRVADVLTATANNSAQTLEDLGEAMKYVAPIAQEYGLSLEETAKALGTLANMQIKGSMAGTSLRQMLLQLTDPNIRATIEGLGVAVTDATGKLRTDFGTMMLELGTALKKLPEADRLAILRDLFDQRAAAGAAKLATTNFEGLGRAIDNAAGTAEKTATIMDSGLGGAWRNLESSIEGVQIAIGETLSPILSAIMDKLGNVAGAITEWIGRNRAAIAVAAGLTAAIGGIGAALIGAGVALKIVGTAIGAMSAVVSAVTTGFSIIRGLLTALLNPLGLLVAGLAAIGVYAVIATGAWKPVFEYLSAGFNWIKDIALKAWQGISDALAAGDIELAAQIALTGLQTAWYEAIAWLQEKWVNFKKAIINTWYTAVYSIAEAALFVFGKIRTLWIDLQAVFQKLWAKTTKFIGDAWDAVYYWLARAFTRLTSLFKSAADAAAARKALDEEQAARAREREEKTNKTLAAIERDQEEQKRKINQQTGDVLATLEEDRQRAINEANDNQEKGLDAIRKKAEEARKKFDELTKKAKEAREAKEAQAPEAPTAPEVKLPNPEDIAKTVTMKVGDATRITSQGTFSALAARGLAMSGPLDRIAKASEATAENTKKMTRLLAEATPEFE